MKVFGILVALVLSTTLTAQTDITAGVIRALETGNAGQLASHFGKAVDLTLLGDEGTLAPAAAQKKVEVFFRSHAPKSFKVMHKGTSKLGDQYRIGDLTTTSGTYRVTFFMHRADGGMKVKQLRIESFDEDDF